MIDILSYDVSSLQTLFETIEINMTQGFLGDCDRWELHWATLLKMIEVRGGIHALGTEELRVSVAWWVTSWRPDPYKPDSETH